MKMIDCPRHGGAYDCTPFCELCNGDQEIREEPETMITKADLTIDKTSEGAWRISALVGLHLVTRRYFHYSRGEAVALFLDEVN